MRRALLPIICIFICFYSCKKSNSVTSAISSLNIVNAVIDIPSVYIYFTFSDSNYYLQQSPLSYASSAEYSAISGLRPLSVISSNDTVKPLYQTSLDLKAGGIYSLFLFGHGRQVDTLLVKDSLPLYTDSLAGVRFVNLAPGSLPVSINLEGNYPVSNELSNLAYRQISTFQTYSASSGVLGYNFEIRDQASGNLLATFGWPLPLFRNSTLVITGLGDGLGGGALSIFAVNNF
jgi:hypothetical protein